MNEMRINELKRSSNAALAKMAKKLDYEAMLVYASRMLHKGGTNKELILAAKFFLEANIIVIPRGMHKRPYEENEFHAACCYLQAGDEETACKYYERAGVSGHISGFYRAARLMEKLGRSVDALDLYRCGMKSGHLPSEGRYITLKYSQNKWNLIFVGFGIVLSLIYKAKFVRAKYKDDLDPRVVT